MEERVQYQVSPLNFVHISTTTILAAQLASLLVAATAMVLGQYLALRQKTPASLAEALYKRRARFAGIGMLGGFLGFLTLATVFNVWPGVNPRRQHHLSPTTARIEFLDVPASSVSLLIYSVSVGVISAGLSAHFLLRLFRSIRAGRRNALGQLGDVLLGCLPSFALFYAMVAFFLWLGRISGLGFGELIEYPPRWLMPTLMLWVLGVGAAGYFADRFVVGRRSDPSFRL